MKHEKKTETYEYYVKTDWGYWGMGHSLEEALRNAHWQLGHTAYVSLGEGIYWDKSEERAKADEWLERYKIPAVREEALLLRFMIDAIDRRLFDKEEKGEIPPKVLNAFNNFVSLYDDNVDG